MPLGLASTEGLDEAATRSKSDAPSRDVMCMIMSSILAA